MVIPFLSSNSSPSPIREWMIFLKNKYKDIKDNYKWLSRLWSITFLNLEIPQFHKVKQHNYKH
jgi:hypothetical protein